VQGTVFAPTAQYAMAASPDALLEGNDSFKALLEVKCACPYIEKDDGRGWDIDACKVICVRLIKNGVSKCLPC